MLAKLSEIPTIVWLLTGLVVFFAIALFIDERLWPNDGQFFQVISGLTEAFAAALIALLRSEKS
jgi:hypothetical protein